MSDEMMLQTQRPSAAPYLLGGAAVGAAAGGFQPWIGLKKPKYESFEDIIAEQKDTFTTAKNDAKDEDVKNAYDKVISERDKYDQAVEKSQNDIKALEENKANYDWAEKLEKEGKALDTAEGKAAEARNSLLEEIQAKIKDGKITVDGLKAEDVAKDENADKLKEAAEKYLTDNESKLDAKNADNEFKKVKEKANALYKKKEEVNRAKDDLTEAMKKENIAEKDAKVMNKATKDAIEELKKVPENAKKDAETAIKDSLEKIKTLRKGWNAVIGAAILGLGALALRPKAKNDV